jgi:hypothetical protein
LGATRDENLVAREYSQVPDAKYRPHHGAVDVLDTDGTDDNWQALMGAALQGAPEIYGPTVITPRGHHVYVAPTGRGLATGLGGPRNLDWRGIDGYTISRRQGCGTEHPQAHLVDAAIGDVGSDRGAVPALTTGPSPQPVPPNRTCDFRRIRLS